MKFANKAIQLQEEDALKAIFIDDFIPVDIAWKEANPHAFKIKIYTNSSESSKDTPLLSVFLDVQLTRTYPESPPKFKIVPIEGLSLDQARSVYRAVKNASESLVGNEMIFDLVNTARDCLESFRRDIIDPKATVKRSIKQSTAIEEEIEMQSEHPELGLEISAEMERKKELLRLEREKRKEERCISEAHEQEEIDTEEGFRAVKIGQGRFGQVYLYRPKFQDSSVLALKEIHIPDVVYQMQDNKDKMKLIFVELDRLKSLNLPSIAHVKGYKFQEIEKGNWKLSIMTDYIRGDNLGQLITKCGSFDLLRALQYIKDLLQILVELHDRNIAVRNLNTENVYVSDQGKIILTDVSYTSLLEGIIPEQRINQWVSQWKKWLPQEISRLSILCSRKSDIWFAGVIFLCMVYGFEILSLHSNFVDTLHLLTHGNKPILQRDIPHPVKALIERFFVRDHSVRASAADLLEDPCFSALESGFSFENIISSARGRAVSDNIAVFLNRSETARTAGYSRFKVDFEELESLGQGAFGSVVKARNVVDNRIYAIKKIKLDPKRSDYNRKILREAMTLSRLSHEYVVRYYNAWIEDADDGERQNLNSEGETSSDAFVPDYSAEENSDDDIVFAEESENDAEHEDSRDDDVDWLSPDRRNMRRMSDTPGRTHTERSDEFVRNVHRPQNLFIQMEYCLKKTLRDVIDEGLDCKKAWKMFRQIVEALVHIHSHKILHRDLKPSNIFISEDGDVKVGDFGLATLATAGNTDDLARPLANLSIDLKTHHHDASLTSGVGTTNYVSPELQMANASYNQKVDIYSLGVIFFEMWHPFKTGMERAVCLKNIRKPEISFPEDWDSNALASQSAICRQLLSHNPADRPTAMEVLHSSHLPTNMEDEYIQEALRTIANPNTPYYNRLMSTLFSNRLPDKLIDYTYDIETNAFTDLEFLFARDKVIETIRRVFVNHGAVSVRTPLLRPKSGLSSINSVDLIDKAGNVVSLPCDLMVPFARQMARCPTLPYLKRYNMDFIYRLNVAGGSPKEILECDFDIVTSLEDKLNIHEAEVIKTVLDIVSSFPFLTSKAVQIRVNHTSLSLTFFKGLGFSQEQRLYVLEILANNFHLSWPQLRARLLQNKSLSSHFVDLLKPFFGSHDSREELLKKANQLRGLSAFHDALEYLQKLERLVREFGGVCQFVIDPLMAYRHQHYFGMMFQVHITNSKGLFEQLAAGGRYDSMISQFRHPNVECRPNFGVGYSLAIEKIIQMAANFNSGTNALDVFVSWTSKDGEDVEAELMKILSELWAANIRAEYGRGDFEASADFAEKAKYLGARWVVTLKDKSTTRLFPVVKIKNLEKNKEVEVPRSELCKYLLTAASSRELELTTSVPSSSSPHVHEDLNVIILQIGDNQLKLKYKQKNAVQSKAYQTVVKLFPHSAVRGMDVIAVDLNREQICKLLGAGLLEADSVRKPNERDLKEYVPVLRAQISDLQASKKISSVFLYSIKDGFAAICAV